MHSPHFIHYRHCLKPNHMLPISFITDITALHFWIHNYAQTITIHQGWNDCWYHTYHTIYQILCILVLIIINSRKRDKRQRYSTSTRLFRKTLASQWRSHVLRYFIQHLIPIWWGMLAIIFFIFCMHGTISRLQCMNS